MYENCHMLFLNRYKKNPHGHVREDFFSKIVTDSLAADGFVPKECPTAITACVFFIVGSGPTNHLLCGTESRIGCLLTGA